MGERGASRMGMLVGAMTSMASAVSDKLLPPTQKINRGNPHQGHRRGLKPDHEMPVTGRRKAKNRVSSRASHHNPGYMKRAAKRRMKGR